MTETVTNHIADKRYVLPADSEEVFVIFNPVIAYPKSGDKIKKALPTIKLSLIAEEKYGLVQPARG